MNIIYKQLPIELVQHTQKSINSILNSVVGDLQEISDKQKEEIDLWVEDLWKKVPALVLETPTDDENQLRRLISEGKAICTVLCGDNIYRYINLYNEKESGYTLRFYFVSGSYIRQAFQHRYSAHNNNWIRKDYTCKRLMEVFRGRLTLHSYPEIIFVHNHKRVFVIRGNSDR